MAARDGEASPAACVHTSDFFLVCNAPPPDPLLAACASVGVPDDVLKDGYFLPTLRDAAEVARGCHTQARTQVQYRVRGSHKRYAVQVVDYLTARQAWEQQVGEDEPP